MYNIREGYSVGEGIVEFGGESIKSEIEEACEAVKYLLMHQNITMEKSKGDVEFGKMVNDQLPGILSKIDDNIFSDKQVKDDLEKSFSNINELGKEKLNE